MLTDSSLTNILVVSGVSQIRYRVYSQHCNRDNLTNYLRNTPNYDTSKDILMRAYTNMVSASIPALWRITSESDQPGKELALELWVFWFDERHTGKIDASRDLYTLEEIKVGSFTWENAYSKIQSPTASPIASSAQASSSAPVTVSDEYKHFIKSIRNLVHIQMKSSGAMALGDFYIYPHSNQDIIGQDKISSSSPLNTATSMLCCYYNIYLANTNLIIQPSTRRMRIRPITLQTVRSRGKKVVISPSGETAYIATNTYILPQQTEEKILKQWSLLLDIPLHNLIQQPTMQQETKKDQEPQQSQKSLPNLVAIKSSATDETFYYPSSLIFVSSSSRLQPTAMAGMNGLFGFNQGFSEDLGDKWQRWAWNDKISNYWDYVCPRDTTTTAVLDTLSHENHSSNGVINLLQKAISEPVIASPLMATKSVATPGSACQRNDAGSGTMTPNSSVMDEDDGTSQQFQQPQHQLQQRNKARYQTGLSLVDFAMCHFAIPNLEELPDYPEPLPIIQHPIETESKSDGNTLILPNGNHAVNKDATHTVSSSTYQSPQMPNLELDSFGIVDNMDVDSMVLDMPNRWNDHDMNDLDDYNLGVTEEDFDFFESDPVPPQTMATQPVFDSTFANNMNLDDLMEDQTTLQDFDTAFDIKKEIMPLDDKQQQNILDADLESASLDHSVTPLQVGMSQQDTFANFQKQQDMFSNQQQQQQLQLQQHYEQQQSFVPPQFAPIKIDYAVNIAKYTEGGKFTYTPAPKSKRKGSNYQPDYVPMVRKKKSERRKSSKLLTESIENDNNMLNLLESKQPTPHVVVASSNQSLITESETSSSEESSSDESEDEALRVHRVWKSVLRAQDKYLKKITLLGPWRSIDPVSVDNMVMDYDSPFARTIASSVIHNNSQRQGNETEDLKALDYLCQQAVMGGYPFSGGIESMSSNGFEANEGESAKVLVARRRNLLQKFNGDTIHIPSTPNDADVITRTFKKVLSDIFHQKSANEDDMCLDMLPLPATVTVKGPLNVQQYYDLSETNQAHSKYGKYQVKKRRPAEPNLDTLQPPNILINRQDDVIEGSSKLIMFWEKLRLEPYSNKKHVNYFVIYPKNDSIESNVSQFFKGLSTLYETCQLGAHHPGNVGSYRKGLAPVPLLPAQSADESFEDRQLRSYIAECQNLGSALGGAMMENMHIVIYMVNPASHLGSNLELGCCFSRLMGAYHAAAMGLNTRRNDKTRARLVLQILPIEHVLRPTSFGGCLKFGLKEIAFSVYSKCHAIISRQSALPGVEDSKPVTEIYAPPFILTKPVPMTIPFQLKKALNAFPTILESHAVLHLGYSFSFDKRWMIIVWTDNRGELVEFAVLDNAKNQLPLTAVFEEAWSKTKEIAKRTGFKWTFIIAKIGLLFEEESQAWIQCINNEEKVAIVSLDVESSLYVCPSSDLNGQHDTSNMVETINTPMMNASAAATSHVSQQATSHKKMYNETELPGPGQTKALLLNHRIAYSNKRERTSYGILGMDPVSEVEEWMIPLASGYMIHTPPTTENPNNELFHSNPLVIEIHLLYNQTDHSAYSTLRDIIRKYHDLSYVNVMPSNSNCFPIHLALVERLSRILLVVNP